MKKLHFRYEMQLCLSQDVTEHHFLVRLRPMEDSSQNGLEFRYQITPADTVDEVWDGFGNCGYTGTVRRSHNQLTALSEGIVIVRRDLPVQEELHPMYRYPSAYTMPEEHLIRLCQTAVGRNESKKELERGANLELAIAMARHLHQSFSYARGITTVHTTAAEALRGGSGVCQDYAHILISMCRYAGIPARYVAGLMMGEGATHAWVEIWEDGCWIGIDPTNNRLVDETYIKMTHGRDFGDGSIDRGCFIGSAMQYQQIHVKVEEIA